MRKLSGPISSAPGLCTRGGKVTSAKEATAETQGLLEIRLLQISRGL